MAQKTLEKLNRKVSILTGEVKTLRSFVIGIIAKDQEGEYKEEFIKRVLKNSKEKTGFLFKDSRSFLKQIQKGS